MIYWQHEKLSSQLQLNQKKPPVVESSKSEVKSSETAAASACEGATAKSPDASRVEDKMAGENICAVQGYMA